MTTVLIYFGKHIEQKWYYIVVQGFVIQKQLGQQTKTLTVELKYEDILRVEWLKQVSECKIPYDLRHRLRKHSTSLCGKSHDPVAISNCTLPLNK